MDSAPSSGRLKKRSGISKLAEKQGLILSPGSSSASLRGTSELSDRGARNQFQLSDGEDSEESFPTGSKYLRNKCDKNKVVKSNGFATNSKFSSNLSYNSDSDNDTDLRTTKFKNNRHSSPDSNSMTIGYNDNATTKSKESQWNKNRGDKTKTVPDLKLTAGQNLVFPSDSDSDNGPDTVRRKSPDLNETMTLTKGSIEPSLHRSDSPVLSSRNSRNNKNKNRSSHAIDDSQLSRSSIHESQEPNLRSSVSLDRLNSWETSASINKSKRLNKMERRLNSTQSMLNMETISNQSYSSTTSSLKKIPTQDMKKKTYLVGSMTPNALLGVEQLDSLLPERKVDVMVLTYNMSKLSNKEYPTSFESLFFPDSIENVPDIYVVCTQETPTDKKELLLRCQSTLGPNHVLFDYCVNKSLMVAVFIRRDLLWFVSIPDQGIVTTRRVRIATKGCAAICFTLFGSSMLFISSHFMHDDGRLEDRVEDYNKTVSSLDLPKFTKTSYVQSNDVTERFDYVFWAGDLNFRVLTCNRNRAMIDDVIKGIFSETHPQYDVLLAGDELKSAQSESRIFTHFQEGTINFPPTYKFDPGTDVYDSSQKMRIPSYTDRILFRCNKHGNASCQIYDSVRELKCSDHRAVYGLYFVVIRPGIDNIPLASGQFCRDIYTEGNRRRALQLDLAALNNNAESSAVCSVM